MDHVWCKQNHESKTDQEKTLDDGKNNRSNRWPDKINPGITLENKRAIDKEIHKSCRNDKNQHIARLCQELKEHANTN